MVHTFLKFYRPLLFFMPFTKILILQISINMGSQLDWLLDQQIYKVEYGELLSLFEKNTHIKAKPGNTIKRLSHLNLSWSKLNTSILKSEAIG